VDVKEKWETIGWIGLGIAWIVSKLYEYIKSKKKKIPETDANNDLDKKIYPILHKIRNKFRGSSVYLQQFHDGQRAYSGQSLQRKTITHEVTDADVTPINGRLINDSTHRYLSKLRTYGDYYIPDVEALNVSDAEKGDVELYQFCRDLGVKSLYYLRIADIKEDVTIATLNLHFPFKDALFDPAYRNEIKRYRNQLESIFDKI
jgi:hypothetical protein